VIQRKNSVILPSMSQIFLPVPATCAPFSLMFDFMRSSVPRPPSVRNDSELSLWFLGFSGSTLPVRSLCQLLFPLSDACCRLMIRVSVCAEKYRYWHGACPPVSAPSRSSSFLLPPCRLFANLSPRMPVFEFALRCHLGRSWPPPAGCPPPSPLSWSTFFLRGLVFVIPSSTLFLADLGILPLPYFDQSTSLFSASMRGYALLGFGEFLFCRRLSSSIRGTRSGPDPTRSPPPIRAFPAVFVVTVRERTGFLLLVEGELRILHQVLLFRSTVPRLETTAST